MMTLWMIMTVVHGSGWGALHFKLNHYFILHFLHIIFYHYFILHILFYYYLSLTFLIAKFY